MTSVSPRNGTVDVAGCVASLAQLLGSNAIYTAEGDRAGYERGARYGNGRAAFVARPASTEQVALVVETCARHGVGIVPQGANTGLVGASTPDASGSQCVLSLERLTRTLELNALNRSVKVSAGIRLSALNEALRPAGLWFPIDLGADPSIGGMIATNTGGTRFIRYGDVRKNVLGIEVVTRDGSILDFMDSVRKNNTGLDAKQLFIGTGGRLGIVTHAVLEVHPLPREIATALIVPSSDNAILDLLASTEAMFGPQLTSFEGMSGTALACALDHGPSLRNPFALDGVPDYALLIEISDWGTGGQRERALQDQLEACLANLLDRGLITNAFVHDAETFWSIRHHISDSLKFRGRVIALDVSVPRDRFIQFRSEARTAVGALAGQVAVADFGHVGDGGTHFNMIWPDAVPYQPEVAEVLRVTVYNIVRDHGGSFSAEHGIGPFNERFYRSYVSKPKRDLEERIAELLAAATPGQTCVKRNGSALQSQSW